MRSSGSQSHSACIGADAFVRPREASVPGPMGPRPLVSVASHFDLSGYSLTTTSATHALATELLTAISATAHGAVGDPHPSDSSDISACVLRVLIRDSRGRNCCGSLSNYGSALDMPRRLSANYKFMNKLLTGAPTQTPALASELAAVENISYGLYRTKIWR